MAERPASPRHGAGQHNRHAERQRQADVPGAACLGRVASAEPVADARAGRQAERKRHHIDHSREVRPDLVRGGCRSAESCDEQRHQREGRHLDRDGQCGRDAEPGKAAQLAPVDSLHALPQCIRQIADLVAQQPQRRATDGVVDRQRGPAAADHAECRQAGTTKAQPDRQRQLDQQRAELQPGHQHRLAEALIERAVDSEQQGRRQCEGQHVQVATDFAAHGGRHVGPAHQHVGVQQQRHAGQADQRTQVERLTHRTADVRVATGTVQLGPDRQQGLQQPRQRHEHGDEDGRANRQRRQCAFGIAARDDGVGHAKGHHRELPDQYRRGMARDQAGFAAHEGGWLCVGIDRKKRAGPYRAVAAPASRWARAAGQCLIDPPCSRAETAAGRPPRWSAGARCQRRATGPPSPARRAGRQPSAWSATRGRRHWRPRSCRAA